MKGELLRAAVIDVGTSSIKLTIGEAEGGNIRILESLKNLIPIGRSSFFRGRVSQEAIQQCVRILKNYKEVLKEYKLDHCKVIATTAVREASNRDIFIDIVYRQTGFWIEVLTVCDTIYYIDAYLSYILKDAYPIEEKNLLIAELGGGNLDISVLAKGLTLLNLGLPIGTLRIGQLASSLDGSLVETYEAVHDFIEMEFSYFKRLLPRTRFDDLLLIDETYFSYLFKVIPDDFDEYPTYRITQQNITHLIGELLGKSGQEISHRYKIPLEIAETLLYYGAVLELLLVATEKDAIYILNTSLSEAILANILLGVELSKKYDKAHQLVSMARSLCKRYNADFNHVTQTARLAETLFQHLKEPLGLEENHRLYLVLSAYLHDLGGFIHNRAHHKHTEYIVSCLDLFSLSQEEVQMLSCIARYHRKAEPKSTHLQYGSLPLAKKILIQKLSAILRIATALDASHKQKVRKLEVAIAPDKSVLLTATVQGNFLLEKHEFGGYKALFENISGTKIQLSIQEEI